MDEDNNSKSELEILKDEIDKLYAILAMLDERTQFLEENHPEGKYSCQDRRETREIKRRMYRVDRNSTRCVAIFGKPDPKKAPY